MRPEDCRRRSSAKDEKEETPEERLQRVPHTARIGIWDIRSKALLLRMRAEAAGEFVVGDPCGQDARNRRGRTAAGE